jgi:hypothetical protein
VYDNAYARGFFRVNFASDSCVEIENDDTTSAAVEAIQKYIGVKPRPAKTACASWFVVSKPGSPQRISHNFDNV